MWRDIVLAQRWLRKNPLFSAIVTATLALGIGANTAVFSIVDAVLLRPLPYAAPGRLVRVTASLSRNATVPIATEEYLRRLGSGGLLPHIAAYRIDVVTLTGIE